MAETIIANHELFRRGASLPLKSRLICYARMVSKAGEGLSRLLWKDNTPNQGIVQEAVKNTAPHTSGIQK